MTSVIVIAALLVGAWFFSALVERLFGRGALLTMNVVIAAAMVALCGLYSYLDRGWLWGFLLALWLYLFFSDLEKALRYRKFGREF